MSLGINGNNGINVNANTSGAKGIATQSAGSNNSVNFNYDELHKLFLEKGLSAVMEKLSELKEAGLVTEFSVGSNNYGNTVIKFSVGDNKYQFTGAKGDSVDTEPETTTPKIPKTDGGVSSTQSVGDGSSVEAPTASRALTQAELEARKKNSNYYKHDYSNANRKLDFYYGDMTNVDFPGANQPSSIFGAALPGSSDYYVTAYQRTHDKKYLEDGGAAETVSYMRDFAVAVLDKLNVKYENRKDAERILLGGGWGSTELTQEQINYVNTHPEEFYGVQLEIDDNGKHNGANLGPYYELLCYSKANFSPEETYWNCVNQFSKGLSNVTDGRFRDAAICNGDTVKFTDDSINRMKELLNSDEFKLDGLAKKLGLEKGDDETTIRKKIEDFCYSLGSTDGKTVLLEDYYNACSEAGEKNEVSNKLFTYDEIVRNINNAINIKMEECERLGIDISDLNLTKPTYTKVDLSEINGDITAYGYSSKYYNDDIGYSDSVKTSAGISNESTGNANNDITRYLNELKNKYPEIYEKYKDTLLDLTNGSLLGSGYGAHRDIDISLNSSRNGLAKVLMSAAGITDSEYSNATNGDLSAWQSMNNKLAQTFGAEIKNDNYYNAKSTAITVDFAQVMNYLLGENASGTNYFYASGEVEGVVQTSKIANPINKTEEQNTMGAGGVGTTNASDKDIDNEYNRLKQEAMDSLASRIKSANVSFLGLVDIDSNGNVVISDNAKETLKQMLLDLANSERADIDLYDENVAQLRAEGFQSGSNYHTIWPDKILELFGLSQIPYSGDYKDHPQMYAWIENIESIANDDSKLDGLLTNYLKSTGSTNGKTTSLEKFYDAIAESGYRSYDGTNSFDIKTDSQLKTAAKANLNKNNYINSLKEKYPEIYERFGSYIEDTYDTYDGTIRFDAYITSDKNDTYFAGVNGRIYQYLWAKGPVLEAAGVTEDDSISTQRNKLEQLAKKMGITGNNLQSSACEIDVSVMMNYLLGDNPEGINYCEKYMAEFDKNSHKYDDVQLDTVPTDSSIDVVNKESISKTYIKGVEDCRSDVNNEIRSFIKTLLDPIYEKYFASKGNGSGYVNLSYYRDPDTGYYTWNDETTKNAFAKEVESVIQQALAKYSDMLTSISFDGREVKFTTKYDSTLYGADDVAGNFPMSNGKYVRIADDAEGPICDIEPAIDNPISYLNPPSIIKSTIPANAPMPTGSNDSELVKTAWDGIFISKDGGYLYVWDTEKKEYIEIQSSYTTEFAAQKLANGESDALMNFMGEAAIYANGGSGYDYYINRIIISHVLGCNLTSVANILEKDGKYYQIDESKSGYEYIVEGQNTPKAFESLLNEVTFANYNTQSKEIETAITFENKKPVNTETTDIKTEEIIYKSDEVVTEMQAAAEKLNLTSAKTTGTYYQFSEQGTYLYVWNPENKKFKAFSINTRNTDGSINKEFTQAGKAINRTETNIYYEALLEAYKNGYNFTANYPWVCEKDGIYYEYDKEAGCFKKKAE